MFPKDYSDLMIDKAMEYYTTIKITRDAFNNMENSFYEDKKKSRIYKCIYLGNKHTKETEGNNWNLISIGNDGTVSNNICILFSASMHFEGFLK